MTRLSKALAGLACAILTISTVSATSALAASPLIRVNENGTGTLNFSGRITPLTGVLANDPGPGGLASVLTYDLLGPPSLTPGDLLLTDDGVVLDVVRFNDYNTGGVQGYRASLLFYSDNIDGFDALADTSGPPAASYTNVLSIPEVGSEHNNGAYYHPETGQPGYVPGFDVAYWLQSDVPEPAAWTLMLIGLGGLGLALRARRVTVTT
jgi:hypothetical protein